MNRWSLLMLTGLITCLLAPYAIARGQDASLLKRGAQLYDNWPKLTETTLSGSHPLYPGSGKKQGLSSWRCKECHGWDYLGRDGRYAEGSHYTGIAGVLDQRGRQLDDIRAQLTDGTARHDFSLFLDDRDLDALATFLRDGLTDISQVIDAAGKATGPAEQGRGLYVKNCADCHGDDGRTLDFKSKKDGLQGVGWLANENPQETWHKILWGHPGSDMPAMWVDVGLTREEASALLAYCQSLP